MQSAIKRTLTCALAFKDTLYTSTRRRVLTIRSLQTSATLLRHKPTLFNRTPLALAKFPRCLSYPIRHRSSQVSDTVFPDPNRPDLFYHLVHAPTPVSNNLPAFALTFLDASPPTADSSTVIGWLPAQTYGSNASMQEGDPPAERTASLQVFVPNDKFMGLLHETIKAGLADGVDEIWKDNATALQSGWMHIHDQRNIPALDRIGDPDDIIATVLVEDGKMLVDTYQPMPAYRVCTADGVMQLTPGLSHYLQNKLQDLTKSGGK